MSDEGTVFALRCKYLGHSIQSLSNCQTCTGTEISVGVSIHTGQTSLFSIATH